MDIGLNSNFLFVWKIMRKLHVLDLLILCIDCSAMIYKLIFKSTGILLCEVVFPKVIWRQICS